MMKVESGAKQAPSILFESATDAHHGLMTYIGLVHRHFVEYGMDALFYFVTPVGSWVSILDGHSQFTREEVYKQAMALFAAKDDASKSLPSERYDVFDVQNLRFSAAFILASISPALRSQVLTKAGKDYDNGPIVWMYVMGLVQSSSYRGIKLLQRTFEERKLKSENGENVIKHTIKLREDYRKLFNSNMVPHDSLMTTIDSLVDCSTSTFAVWASTKQIAISRFLKENAGKTASALSMITDAPTIEAICDEADDEYQSLLESGLWTAIDSKKDIDAAPTAFLIEKLTKTIDRISANQEKKEGTCWTCGKLGHTSPKCPDKKTKKGNDHDRKKSTTYPEWQHIKPNDGESEAKVYDGKTFYWCDTCNHWRTTHGTSNHIRGALTNSTGDTTSKSASSNNNPKIEGTAGNLAEIVESNSDENALVIGAWCGMVSDEDNGSLPDYGIGAWISPVSLASTQKNHSAF